MDRYSASLHGVVMKKDGSKVYVNLGEKEGEPKFVITDLLPTFHKSKIRGS